MPLPHPPPSSPPLPPLPRPSSLSALNGRMRVPTPTHITAHHPLRRGLVTCRCALTRCVAGQELRRPWSTRCCIVRALRLLGAAASISCWRGHGCPSHCRSCRVRCRLSCQFLCQAP